MHNLICNFYTEIVQMILIRMHLTAHLGRLLFIAQLKKKHGHEYLALLVGGRFSTGSLAVSPYYFKCYFRCIKYALLLLQLCLLLRSGQHRSLSDRFPTGPGAAFPLPPAYELAAHISDISLKPSRRQVGFKWAYKANDWVCGVNLLPSVETLPRKPAPNPKEIDSGIALKLVDSARTDEDDQETKTG